MTRPWFERGGLTLPAARAAVREAFPGRAVELAVDGPWLALVDRGVAPPGDAAAREAWIAADLGAPGPWRLAPLAGGTTARTFELPPRACLETQAPGAAKEEDPPGQGGPRTSSFLFHAALGWAAATAPGDAEAAGLAPVAAPPPDLELRWPARDLPPARAAWADRLAADVRRCLRLVRLGRVARAGGAWELAIEVDLRGAPPALAGGYAHAAGAALRRAARWAGPAVELIRNAGIASAVLDRQPPRDPPLQPLDPR